MADHNDIARFVIDYYFAGDLDRAAEATGFSKQRLQLWLDGKRRPQKNNLGWLLHGAVCPKFSIVAEYEPIDISSSEETLRRQLGRILSGREKSSGVYAFYDSMANLVYLGKTRRNMRDECYQQLRAKMTGALFPRGAKQPAARTDVVRYISCYALDDFSEFSDYSKHIEALILRISKPRLNANIGEL